jgi:hypothetical protein
LLEEKSAVLSKAVAFTDLGLPEAAGALWATAASYEERLAPLLEGLGREAEAAVHRISAASCYHKAGDLTRAVNLYRAALGGPLRAAARREVSQMLAGCLKMLTRTAVPPRGGKVTEEA